MIRRGPGPPRAASVATRRGPLASDTMRARDLGIVIGLGRPGPLNAITDVAGVRVGHTTLIEGDGPLVVGPRARSGPA